MPGPAALTLHTAAVPSGRKGRVGPNQGSGGGVLRVLNGRTSHGVTWPPYGGARCTVQGAGRMPSAGQTHAVCL